MTPNEDSAATAERPSDEMGRRSNPPQRRLSATDIGHLVATYQGGATISRLAVEFGVHRTTVAAHLDRAGVPRHSERVAWDEDTLRDAVELYAAGLSLADVGDRFGIDPQTVANRFRRAEVPVRTRRGWNSRPHSEPDSR